MGLVAVDLVYTGSSARSCGALFQAGSKGLQTSDLNSKKWGVPLLHCIIIANQQVKLIIIIIIEGKSS